MTDQEYNFIDELYFMQTADSLCRNLNWPEEDVKTVLLQIFDKGWLKIMISDDEFNLSREELAADYKKYEYIASKKGLLAHNTI